MAIFRDLSHNSLHSISREIFISASKLENLNLSNNLLSQTPPELYLPALKIFSLNNNPLSILNLCKLKGLQQLLNLMVNNNSIIAVEKIKTNLSTRSEIQAWPVLSGLAAGMRRLVSLLWSWSSWIFLTTSCPLPLISALSPTSKRSASVRGICRIWPGNISSNWPRPCLHWKYLTVLSCRT